LINFCSQSERPSKLQNSTTASKLETVMMMMQYTNCVVKAHKVQTVKLTLYKYKS